jgi:hypothetical protein
MILGEEIAIFGLFLANPSVVVAERTIVIVGVTMISRMGVDILPAF